jgi:hypothetical protein
MITGISVSIETHPADRKILAHSFRQGLKSGFFAFDFLLSLCPAPSIDGVDGNKCAG